MSWKSWLTSLRTLVLGPTRRRPGRPRVRPSRSRPSLCVESLEERRTPTVGVSYSAGQFAMKGLSAYDNVAVTTPSTTQIQITLTGDTFSALPANMDPSFFSINPLNTVLTINTVSSTLQTLALNNFNISLDSINDTLRLDWGGVAANNINISAGANDQVTLDNISFGGNLTVSGSGGAAGSVVVTAGDSVTTQGGNISLTGQGSIPQGSAPPPTFIANPVGITVSSGATLNAGGGNVSLTGTGFGSGQAVGVVVLSGAHVQTSGLGTVTIKGTGGAAGGDGSDGVLISGPLTQVSAVNGALAVTGTAGGTGNLDLGIAVQGGAAVLATGVGPVSLTGTGGNGTGNFNEGVQVNGSSVTAGAGGVLLTGTGGGIGAAENGVDLTAATVSATLNGPVTVKGTASPTATSSSDGIFVSQSSLSTVTGPLSLTGTGGGTAGASIGIALQNSSAAASEGAASLTGTGGSGDGDGNEGVLLNESEVSGGAGGVTVTGTGGGSEGGEVGVDLESGATVAAEQTGTVTIKGTGSALGTDANDGVLIAGGVATEHGLSPGAQVTAVTGAVSITGTGGGTTLSNYGIGLLGNPLVSTQGAVSLTGTGGNGTGDTNKGIYVFGAEISAGPGGVTLTGTGGGSGNFEMGVDLESGAIVTAGRTGAVTLKGTGSALGGDNNDGLLLGGTSTQVTALTGAISATGTGGGTGQDNYGISVQAGAFLRSQGAVGLTGTGGNGVGDNNEGILVFGASVTSGPGGLSLTGTGGGVGNGETGVDLEAGTAATATGPITLKGTASVLGTDNNVGILVSGIGTLVSTTSGAVGLSGTGGGAGQGNHGISVQAGAVLRTTVAGPVSLTGTGGNGTSNNNGVFVSGLGTQVTTTSGALSLTGTGGTGTADNNNGVLLSGGAKLSTTRGSVTINANGGGLGNNNDGLAVLGGATLSVAQTGAIKVQATGSIAGTNNCVGTFLSDPGTKLSTLSGAINLPGNGGGFGLDNYGIDVQANAAVQSTSGAVTLTGIAGFGDGANNTGIVLLGGGTVVSTAGKLVLNGTGGTGAGPHDDGILIAGAHTSGSAASPAPQGTIANIPGVSDPSDLPVRTITLPTASLAFVSAGGAFTGQGIPAVVTVAGVDGVANPSLEGITPTLTYFNSAGAQLSGPPSAVATGYTVVASFPGSLDYAGASITTTFAITKATPTVTISAPGGTYSGSAIAATATVTGVTGQAAASLEGVAPTLTYFDHSGNQLAGAPTQAGTYTVTASFAGSADYVTASASATFKINAFTPTVTPTDLGGVATNLQTFAATAVVAGVGGVNITSLGSLTFTYFDHNGNQVAGAPSTKADTYTVLASFSGSADANYAPASASITFKVSPAAMNQFQVSAPTSTTAGNALTVTITAQDQFGNTVPTFSGTITLTSTDAKATGLGTINFPATSGGVPTNGVLTLTNVVLKSAPNGPTGQTISVSSPAPAGTAPATYTGTSNTITVNAASATSLAINTVTAQKAGTPFTVTVTALDAFGNTATSYNQAATLSSSLGAANLLGTTSGNFVNGVLTLTGVQLKKTGSQTLTVTSGSLTSPASNSFMVNPGALAGFSIGNFSTTQTHGHGFSVPLQAVDGCGNLITTFAGTVTLKSNDASAQLPTSNLTFSKGLLTTPNVIFNTVGSDTLVVTFGSGTTAVSTTFTFNVI
jgi:hypothetical protein